MALAGSGGTRMRALFTRGSDFYQTWRGYHEMLESGAHVRCYIALKPWGGGVWHQIHRSFRIWYLANMPVSSSRYQLLVYKNFTLFKKTFGPTYKFVFWSPSQLVPIFSNWCQSSVYYLSRYVRCEAQGKERAKGLLRKVTHSSFVD